MVSRPPSRRYHRSIQGSPEPIAALNRIHILEYAQDWTAREPLVDIRTYCPNVRFAEKICPFLRQRVADMVNVAQDSLPGGFEFKVATALRTFSMQQSGWDRYFARMREEHPTWPLSALRRATNKYHAPYDQKAPPGHCTGGAVDVVLVDANGQPVDVTSPTEGWDAAYTWSDRLASESRGNRMIMVEAMLAAGFSNCRDEYWHYSWGDSAWAVRVGEFECPYGWAHPPVCLETDFPQAAAAGMEIQSTRTSDGRITSAEGCSAAVPQGSADPGSAPDDSSCATSRPAWCVGLYWARHIPVTLHLEWPSAPADQRFYCGAGSDMLEPVADVLPCEDGFQIRVTPAVDRLVLCDRPSLPGA